MHFTKSSAERAAKTLAVIALAIAPLLVFPAAADPYQPIRSAVLAVAMVVVIAMSPAKPISERRVRIAVWAVGGYVGLLFISAAFNGMSSAIWGVHGRFAGLVSTLLYLVVGVAGYVGLGGSMRTLARALSVSILVQSLWMISQSLRGIPVGGSMGNAALAGQWMCVAVAVVSATSLAEFGRWRWVGIASIAAGVFALGVSGSRAAWVGLLMVVGVLAIQARMRAKVPVAIILLMLVIGVSLGGPALSGKLDVEDLASGSAGARLEIWRGTVALIAVHPVLGVGPGRLLYELPRYEGVRRSELEGADTRADVAHNRVLQAGADGGVAAALALTIAWGVAVSAGWARARDGDAASLAATAGLIAFGAQGFFGISTIETDALGWVLGGIALARYQTTRPAVAVGMERLWRYSLVALGAVVAGASLWYLFGDVQFSRGRASFDHADFATANREIGRAIRINPFVDTYRVSFADVAGYESALGLQSMANPALAVLDTGVALEPESYDLYAAKARLLGVAGDEDPGAAADSFRSAMRLYPHGDAIRAEFLAFAQESGDPDLVAEARSLLAERRGASTGDGEIR